MQQSVCTGGQSKHHTRTRLRAAHSPLPQVGVDFYALSFVRDAAVIYELKEYLAQQGEVAGAEVAGAQVAGAEVAGAGCSASSARAGSHTRPSAPHPSTSAPVPAARMRRR